MLAQQCGLEPGDFVWTGGDCHLYSNHLDQAREQLTPRAAAAAEARPCSAARPRSTTIAYEDFEIRGYDPHPHIKAEVAV